MSKTIIYLFFLFIFFYMQTFALNNKEKEEIKNKIILEINLTDIDKIDFLNQQLNKTKHLDLPTISGLIETCKKNNLKQDETLDAIYKTIEYHSKLKQLGFSKLESKNKSILILDQTIYSYLKLKNKKNLSDLLSFNIENEIRETEKKQNKDRMSQEMKRKQSSEKYKRKTK